MLTSCVGGIGSLIWLQASLLLTTTAVFITTPPPSVSIVDYTLRGPYICMLLSFGLLIGGIMVASICVLITRKARADWSERVRFLHPHTELNLKRGVAGAVCNPIPCVLHTGYDVLPVSRHRHRGSVLVFRYAFSPREHSPH